MFAPSKVNEKQLFCTERTSLRWKLARTSCEHPEVQFFKGNKSYVKVDISCCNEISAQDAVQSLGSEHFL